MPTPHDRTETMPASLLPGRSDSVHRHHLRTPLRQENLSSSFNPEEDYRMLAEVIPQIVWTATPDGYNDYFNQRWFEYTGFTPEETYLEQKWSMHPDDQAQFFERRKEASERGTIYEAEYRLRRHDGVYRWHLARGLPVRDDQGKIVKWFGTCTDIDDQKRAAEQLRTLTHDLEQKVAERTQELTAIQEHDRANLERLREIIHNLPMGAVAFDENDTILHANDLFFQLFALPLTAEEFIGHKRQEFMYTLRTKTRDGEEYAREIEKLFADRQPVMNTEIHLKDGRTIARDFMPIFDKGTFRGVLLVFRDISLEKRIDASKSEFMSLASHQLRTPLTAIRWTMGRLEKKFAGRMSTTEEKLLREGRKAANRMADTIDTMLAISRIEAGKVKISSSHIHMNTLLKDLMMQVEEESQQRKQTVTVECADDVTLQSDQHFLREILFNLLNNAMKYTPDGGAIFLKAHREKEHILLSIRDTGYGIPLHQQEKIFTKFFRGENVLHIDTNGTGLGLYLAYLLVHMLHGTITFESKEHDGTTFFLSFPVHGV